MEVKLVERYRSPRAKLLKILFFNLIIWTATFLGYGYIDELFSSEFEGGGKLAAIIFMGPAIAVYMSILIGIEEQRQIVVNADGFRFGGPISGFSSYSWPDIKHIEFRDADRLLAVRTANRDEKTLKLKQYTGSQVDYDNMLALFQQSRN